MRTPSRRSASPMPRRAAHCVQTVTRPAPTTAASRSASGAASGSAKASARPGTPNHAASPVSQSETSAPEATAAAATVKRLVAALGFLRPAGHLDDKWSGHPRRLR